MSVGEEHVWCTSESPERRVTLGSVCCSRDEQGLPRWSRPVASLPRRFR
jgi:hypothetical protein